MNKITDFQRNNLKKLATFLETYYDKLQFDMANYGPTNNPNDNCCGTIACAAGHGPLAGIEIKGFNNWCAYVIDNLTNFNHYIWTFLFSDKWRVYDNTPLGAAARIRYFLDHEDSIEDYCASYDPSLYENYLKHRQDVP